MKQRIRIHYTKEKILRYTSTLDMQKMWERIFRRAELPLVYSKGFHPQPKIQLACPLPLGLTSKSEIVDFWLEQCMDEQLLTGILKKNINQGLMITEVKPVELNAPALQTRLLSSVYRATINQNANIDAIHQKIGLLLSAHEIIRTRRNKKYDLRPLIESLEAETRNGVIEILMRLSIKAGGPHGRPDEVLSALDLDPLQASIERVDLMLAECG